MKKRYKILTDPNTLFEAGDSYKWNKEEDKKENWRRMGSDRWVGETLAKATGNADAFKNITWRREIKKKNIG